MPLKNCTFFIKMEANTVQQYHMLQTPQFVIGRGSLSFIGTLEKKRIGIVRGGRSYNDQVKEVIENICKETNAEICYLTQIQREPEIDDIFSCMEKVHEFQPDMIVAIGGGSVLDTAKAIHLFYENPDMSFEDALIPFTLPQLGKKAVHISIPTTSGTGSETTSVAVFIDPKTRTKKLVMDPNLIPQYAIIDANMTDSLSNNLRISTGMDALTHALEASVAKNASPMVKSIAIGSVLDILQYLPLTIEDAITKEERISAREKVHIASALAGVSITNSCTGIVHSYDHPGPYFGISHGEVCGLMLPYTLQFVGIQEEYLTIAKRLGYHGTHAELMDSLQNHLVNLSKQLQMKDSFSQYNISEDVYFAQSKIWAQQSLSAFATQVSPAEMTAEKGEQLYRDCYFGWNKITK